EKHIIEGASRQRWLPQKPAEKEKIKGQDEGGKEQAVGPYGSKIQKMVDPARQEYHEIGERRILIREVPVGPKPFLHQLESMGAIELHIADMQREKEEDDEPAGPVEKLEFQPAWLQSISCGGGEAERIGNLHDPSPERLGEDDPADHIS